MDKGEQKQVFSLPVCSEIIMFVTNCLDSAPVCDSPDTYTEEKLRS